MAQVAQEKAASSESLQPTRSLFRSVALIASCAAAMIVNVSLVPVSLAIQTTDPSQRKAATNTSAAIALPSVGQDLRISPDKLQWLVSAFALSSGCLLLFFGRLADLYGRKKAFMLGSLVQAVFSLGCGFVKSVLSSPLVPQTSQSFPPGEIAIDVLRGIQGCGAAATIPACVRPSR